MSVLKHQLRLKCSRCGRWYTLKNLETTQPDPDSDTLLALAKQIGENGMCENCMAKHTHEAKKALHGEASDYNQRILTLGLTMPSGPTRVTCENCGEGNHPFRDTCRICKWPLNPRRLYDARGKIIYQED